MCDAFLIDNSSLLLSLQLKFLGSIEAVRNYC